MNDWSNGSRPFLKPENYELAVDAPLRHFESLLTANTLRYFETPLTADTPLCHFESVLDAAYALDPIPNEVLELLRTGARHCNTLSITECSEDSGRLQYRGRLYIPNSDELRLHILRQAHDAPAAGHPGRAKTLELIGRDYFWPGMRKDVDRYVRNCYPCRRAKASRKSPFGTLRPNPVPDAPWQDISMDLVVGLPKSKGYDGI